MQLRCIAALVFVLVVWPATASSSASGQYDPNSIDQTQKLLRLLLRLAYHTANRLIRLKSQARLKVEHVVDKDLQNITMKQIIHGTNQSTTKPPEIQGRFFALEPKSLSEILSPSETLRKIQNLAPKPAILSNTTSADPLKDLNPLNSSSSPLKQSGFLPNPQESLPLNSSNGILPFAGEIGSGLKQMTSLLRILPSSNKTSGLLTPNPASSDGHKSHSQVMKRETSSVVSVSNVTNQKAKFPGNFSKSNVTDGELKSGSTGMPSKLPAVIAKVHDAVRKNLETSQDHLSCAYKDLASVFDLNFDEEYDADFEELISNVKLEDISAQIIVPIVV